MMTERDLRERVKIAYEQKRERLSELSLEVASLMMAYKKSSTNTGAMQVSRKNAAFTAMTEQMGEMTAIIEFVESLRLDEGQMRGKNLREELRRRHAGLVRSLESSATELSGRLIKLQQTCMQSRDSGSLVPLGEKVRERTASDHARFMKDLAVLGFIQSFGITSRSSQRSDL